MHKFKVGERVLLRPVSIRDPWYVVPADDKLLREIAEAGPLLEPLYWFAGECVDWVSECFLPKPVYIVELMDATFDVYARGFTPEYRIYHKFVKFDIMTSSYDDTPTWIIPETALMPIVQVTQTRRLTVRKS